MSDNIPPIDSRKTLSSKHKPFVGHPSSPKADVFFIISPSPKNRLSVPCGHSSGKCPPDCRPLIWHQIRCSANHHHFIVATSQLALHGTAISHQPLAAVDEHGHPLAAYDIEFMIPKELVQDGVVFEIWFQLGGHKFGCTVFDASKYTSAFSKFGKSLCSALHKKDKTPDPVPPAPRVSLWDSRWEMEGPGILGFDPWYQADEDNHSRDDYARIFGRRMSSQDIINYFDPPPPYHLGGSGVDDRAMIQVDRAPGVREGILVGAGFHVPLSNLYPPQPPPPPLSPPPLIATTRGELSPGWLGCSLMRLEAPSVAETPSSYAVSNPVINGASSRGVRVAIPEDGWGRQQGTPRDGDR